MGGSRNGGLGELEGRRSSENVIDRKLSSELYDQAYWAHDNEIDDASSSRGEEIQRDAYERMLTYAQEILDNKTDTDINNYKSLDVSERKMKVLENYAKRTDDIYFKGTRDIQGGKTFILGDRKSYELFKERAEKSKVPYIGDSFTDYRSGYPNHELSVYENKDSRNSDITELAYDRERGY